MGELLDLDRREDGIAVVTLHHGKVNALSLALLGELRATAEELSSDGGRARAVVITGGSRLFAAGASIDEFASNPDPSHFELASPDRVREIGTAFLETLNAVASIPDPTIASIAGVALGGGCELALACDVRIAADSARFGQPEILLGIIPGGGGTQRLARLVGPSVAKDLVLTGRTIDAAEALRIGLVNRVVARDELDAACLEYAASFARGPRHAIALAKAAIDRGLEGTLHDGLLLEQDCFVDVFATPDAVIGVRSFLVDGPGKAEFTP